MLSSVIVSVIIKETKSTLVQIEIWQVHTRLCDWLSENKMIVKKFQNHSDVNFYPEI